MARVEDVAMALNADAERRRARAGGNGSDRGARRWMQGETRDGKRRAGIAQAGLACCRQREIGAANFGGGAGAATRRRCRSKRWRNRCGFFSDGRR